VSMLNAPMHFSSNRILTCTPIPQSYFAKKNLFCKMSMVTDSATSPMEVDDFQTGDKTKDASSSSSQLPWVEKYRPSR
jgi:hypothetical protein